MKKRPETSTHSSDPDLVGRNESPSWVHGKNCVYRDSSIAQYRVSINTSSGWKSYGHFNDLGTAAYVANIAILVEGREEKYELNKGIDTKDRDELQTWRNRPGNSDLERIAGERFKKVQADLEALHEEERLNSERLSEERAEAKRLLDEKIRTIPTLSNPDLVKFIKATNKYDPLYEIAMKEATQRYNRLGLKRAT